MVLLGSLLYLKMRLQALIFPSWNDIFFYLFDNVL